MFKKLKNRWVSESPRVFKRLTNFCAALGVGATTVLALSVVPGIQLPDSVFKISSWVLLGSTIIGIPSKLTTVKNESIN